MFKFSVGQKVKAVQGSWKGQKFQVERQVTCNAENLPGYVILVGGKPTVFYEDELSVG